MRNIMKRLIVAMTVMMLSFSLCGSLTVYAARSADVVSTYNSMEDGSKERKAVWESFKSENTGSTKRSAADGRTISLTLRYDGQQATKFFTQGEINTLYDTAVGQLEEYKKAGGLAQNSTKQAKDSVKNMMSEFGVEADTGQAAVALAGIHQLVGIIVGILAYAVVIGMSLFTGCDICYITMPVFRTWADTKGSSGGAVTSSTNKDTGESKFRFVTDEAMYAVSQATVENGKNALGIYFKKRCIGWVLTAIVLYVLLTGQITLLTDVILQFISGIIAALQSLGA